MYQAPSRSPRSEDSSVTAGYNTQAEYNTLREEILKRIEGLQQIDASIFLSSFLTIVALSLQNDKAIPILIVLYPVFIMLATVLWVTNDRRIRIIGNYINAHIEKGQGWESYIRNIRRPDTQFDLPDAAKMIALVCFGLLPIPVAYAYVVLVKAGQYTQVFGSLPFGAIIGVDLICVVLSVFMLLHTWLFPIPMLLEHVMIEEDKTKQESEWHCRVKQSPDPDASNHNHVEYYEVHTRNKKTKDELLKQLHCNKTSSKTVTLIGHPDSAFSILRRCLKRLIRLERLKNEEHPVRWTITCIYGP